MGKAPAKKMSPTEVISEAEMLITRETPVEEVGVEGGEVGDEPHDRWAACALLTSVRTSCRNPWTQLRHASAGLWLARRRLRHK